jgi:hypothetical protein
LPGYAGKYKSGKNGDAAVNTTSLSSLEAEMNGYFVQDNWQPFYLLDFMNKPWDSI